MKPKSTLRSFLLLAGSALLAAPLAHAFTLTWDATAGGAINDGGGVWLTAGQWNDSGNPSVNWTSGDDAIFGVGGVGGAVTLASPTVVNSLTFNSYITTGYTLGTAAQTITLNTGITKNAGGVAASIISPITLGGVQTWTNNSAADLSAVTAGINNNGNTLTVAGTGNTNFNSQSASFVLSGAGGLIKNGSGLLTLGGAGATQPTHTYGGDITINGGGILIGSTGLTSATTGNLKIEGGRLVQYFGNSFTRAIGTGANQIQITDGVSGFSGQGATASSFAITGIWKWGDTTFNPDEFVLQDAFTNADGKGTFSSNIDLNGAYRTVRSDQSASNIAGSGTFSGVISNSSGTEAGLIKTGIGHHILSATNTYNGSTTITQGTLTANSTAALGNSSATNTLIFNGGTLRAGAAITSVAARGVTMTSTGIIDTNTFAVSIAGNIGGAGGLTKNNTGTLTLSGTNNYGGVSTVNAGTLAITKQISLASNTAANLNVKSGATLAVNVDSAGTAGFTAGNLTTLLGNISVASTAAQGLQAGATIGIDTGTATGATFTLGSAIANSTGAFGGVINLNKLGAGTLVMDQANTYTGSTIISAGTIQYTDGVAAPTTPIVNNSAFTSNATGALVQGTNFGLISGTGTVAQTSAGTLTLNLANTYTGTTTATLGTIILGNALAIQNSALNTTGAGFVTLSGVTTPTFGGLSNSGTTRDLATVISTGYGSVTNLTLNPAGSVTYDGVIADGAAGMTLTKTGAGTQTLTGIQTYTGATILKGGTLNLSGTGSILPSAITLNGGGLTLTNTAAETGSGRVHDTTVVTSNGGTLTYANTSGANVYAETIGTLNLVKGQANLVLSTDQVGAGSQTLTLAGLTRTGANNPSAITFSAAGAGLNATKNRILVTGATPLPTAAGDIIAPWATIGSAANVQTAFAAYDASGYVVAAVPTVAAVDTDLASASGNYDINTGTLYTLTGTRTVNAVQFRGSASTLDLATFRLETTGFFFNGGTANTKTITGTGTGALTTPSGGGNLYITTGQVMTAGNEHKINAPITNNSGVVNLVKSGAGTLRLNGANTFTGGIDINAGTLQIGTNATVNGANLNGGTYAGNIFIAAGANLDFQTDVNQTLSGVISGDGNLLKRHIGTLTLSGANTYTGKTTIGAITNANSPTLVVSSFNSFNGGTPLLANSSLGAPTTLANATIEMGSNNSTPNPTLKYVGTGEITDRIINFTFNSSATRTLDASNGSGLLKFTSPFTANNLSSGQLAFTGTGAGEIAGLPFLFGTLTKSGAGTWTIGGSLGNASTTTVSGGTLVLSGPVSTVGLTTVSGTGTLILSGNNSTMAGGVTLSTAGTGSNTPKLHINTATALGTGTLNFGGGLATDTVQIDNSSVGAVTVSTANPITLNRNFTFIGTQSLNLGTGTATIGGLTAGTNRNINVSANTLTFGGIVAASVANAGINKQGAGTLVLSGNNTYTGATAVTTGTLALGANNVLPDTSNVTIANGTLNAATFDDTAGTLTVTDPASAINLGTGANLVFADSSAVAWTGALNITGTFVSGSSIKFATSGGLTGPQLASITLNGSPTTFSLDGSGFLVTGGGPVGFAAWQAANSTAGARSDDHDNDGVDNGTEHFLGGTANTTGFTALPGVTNNLGTLSVTWTKAASYTGAYTTDFVVETSATLAAPWAVIATNASPNVANTVHISGNNVTYTFPAGTKNFARLKVTGP